MIKPPEFKLELKAVSHILPAHEVQLVNDLKATGLEVGLLINFAAERVEVQRRIQVFSRTNLTY